MLDLDRVLLGRVAKAFVAAKGGCQLKKSQAVARVVSATVVESAGAGQPQYGALDDPPSTSRPHHSLDSMPLRAMADADVSTPYPPPQMADTLRLVGMRTFGLGTGRVVVVSNGEMGQHQLSYGESNA